NTFLHTHLHTHIHTHTHTHIHTHTHTAPAYPWVYTVIYHRAWGPALALTGVLLERAAEAYFRFPSSHPPRSSTTAGRARQSQAAPAATTVGFCLALPTSRP